MEVTGKVHLIGDEQQVTASYKKRELVVKTDEQYPQHINIEFGQDKCDLLNGLSIGQEVKVHINIGGREWTNPQGEVKYFNSIKGWRVEKLSDALVQTAQPSGPVPDNDSGLPF
jgi:hypothetical protein